MFKRQQTWSSDNTPLKKAALTVGLAYLSAAAMPAFAEPMTLGEVEVSGYLDMSINSTDTDDQGTESDAGLDRAEVRFKSQLDEKVSIEAHVAGGADEDYDLEQANVSFQATDEVSIIAGKYLSALGWEAFHAPDLYQWSTSVALTYPGMFNGVGAKYKTDAFEVYGSVSSNVWESTDKDATSLGYEGAFRLTAIENFTLFAGFATSKLEDTMGGADYDQTLVNVWASYTIGSLLMAVEYNDLSDWGAEGVDGDSWLAMANYGFTDKFSVTVRTSAIDVDDGDDLEKYTVAALYSLTDNVSLVAEINTTENKVTDQDSDQAALEMIVVF